MSRLLIFYKFTANNRCSYGEEKCVCDIKVCTYIYSIYLIYSIYAKIEIMK